MKQLTINLGTHKTVSSLIKTIEKESSISSWAKEIAKGVTLSKKKKTIELEVVTVRELGFPNGATRKEIYDKAMSLGYGLCPPEVGLQLRLQYKDQPQGEWILVAMEPIADSNGRLGVWDVAHSDDGRWLGALHGYPGDFWDADDSWVFTRRKSSETLNPGLEPLSLVSAIERVKNEGYIIYKEI